MRDSVHNLLDALHRFNNLEKVVFENYVMKRLCAEMLGTFGLVFAGTGAIVINDAGNGAITHAGITLTFGLIVLTMISTFGDISGAHANRAVTFGFWAARRLPGRDVPP